jgi:cytoskeleton protein RodZ
MFALGPSLREARLKRGLELDAVQKVLRIRRRYLEALEDERFELIPGEVYARGFLREYAEFLGLDSSLYIDEYNSRFAHYDDVAIAARPTAPRLRRERRVPIAAAIAVPLVVAGAVLAWMFGGGGGNNPPASRAAATTQPRTVTRPKPKPAVAAPTPKPPRLVVKASRGDCWLLVRSGSADGPVLYENILHEGRSVRFAVRRAVWVRFGNGSNVDAWLRGRPLHNLPEVTGDLLLKS